MLQYVFKFLISATVVVAVSELAKRSSLWGAGLASLPLTSLLAFVWLYLDSGDLQKISGLSNDIFWLVLPSLTLFIALPLLIRVGLGFWLSLLLSCLVTAFAYFSTLKVLRAFGIDL